MNTEELYSLIGKLYVDIVNMKQITDSLQSQLKEKEKEIANLANPTDNV